jgi:hypothetical protein
LQENEQQQDALTKQLAERDLTIELLTAKQTAYEQETKTLQSYINEA